MREQRENQYRYHTPCADEATGGTVADGPFLLDPLDERGNTTMGELLKRGRQPHDGFAMIPNETARDSRLSFRSRGILTFIYSHAEGWDITADRVATEGKEGRDAVRTAFRELEDAGYMRRPVTRLPDGTFRTDVHVYPYGDAPTPENPSSVDPAPENPAPDNQSSLRTPPTEDILLSPDAAVSPSVSGRYTGLEGDLTSSSEEPTSTTPREFPRWEMDTLIEWFDVKDGAGWLSAWRTAEMSKTAVEYDPSIHLNAYLIRCKDQNQKPRPDLWLRWFIEDRAKYAQSLAADEERTARQGIDPQEREERQNRSLPPMDWGVTPTEGENP